jgi:hypothetical protein
MCEDKNGEKHHRRPVWNIYADEHFEAFKAVLSKS